MDENASRYRTRAAAAARAYLRGELSWEGFIAEFGGPEDDLVSDLVDLIEHEPKRGGLFGLDDKEWAKYQARVDEVIRALEA
ncbi:hypothetical protein FBR04_06800 [Betaproteobacteria bacterium PRO7]|jgi:hypothetical protein|nr:hypothetical protein [Betaproteobacteria bacterium PRO7]